jgi:hypothetical protein
MLNAGLRVMRITRWRIVTGWSASNLETPWSESDLHITADSARCALRRWRSISLIPALGGDGCGVGVVAVAGVGVGVVFLGALLPVGQLRLLPWV